MSIHDEQSAKTDRAIPPELLKSALTLRQRAEGVALREDGTSPFSPSAEVVRQTLHELQVHQIELEMQANELRTAQTQLQIERDRYVDLYDLAPVGYCTLSEHGLFLQANLTMGTFLGVARGTLVKQPISKFIFAEDQDIFYLMSKAVIKTRQLRWCELRMARTDGTPLWVHLAAKVVEDESTETRFYVVISDITERKLAQMAKVGADAALVASDVAQRARNMAQTRISALVDAAMDAIISVDADMRVTLFNQAAEKMFGVPSNEAMGASLDRFMPARYRQAHSAHMRDFGAQSQPARNMGKLGAITGLRFSGEEFPIEASISYLVVAGQPLYTIFLRDITERKKAE